MHLRHATMPACRGTPYIVDPEHLLQRGFITSFASLVIYGDGAFQFFCYFPEIQALRCASASLVDL